MPSCTSWMLIDSLYPFISDRLRSTHAACRFELHHSLTTAACPKAPCARNFGTPFPAVRGHFYPVTHGRLRPVVTLSAKRPIRQVCLQRREPCDRFVQPQRRRASFLLSLRIFPRRQPVPENRKDIRKVRSDYGLPVGPPGAADGGKGAGRGQSPICLRPFLQPLENDGNRR